MTTLTTQRHRQALEDRAKAWSQVQDIQARRAAAGYSETQEDGETYTRALDVVERLSQIVEEEERAARLSAAMTAPLPDQRAITPGAPTEPTADEAYRAAFATYLRAGMAGASQEEQRLLQAGFAELRAGAAGTTTAGGYTVPQTFLQRMTEVRKAFGGIGALAEEITTSNGDPIVWPTNDDTGNVGAILAENTAVTEQDFTFGQNTLGAYMYTSKLVRLSLQLLQDSAFDLESWVAGKFGERIGRATAAHFAVGTGTAQPQGLVTGLTLGVTSAAAGAIGYDDLVDLEHAIDPAYRANAQYVLNDSVIKTLRKAKDSTGRPLWVPALTAGAPSTINGRPYTVDNSLAAQAAGSKSVVYGDIRAAYIVRAVTGAQTLRLTERFAEYLQVGFLGFQRIDGRVQDTQAAAVLTTHA